jgi:cardiolipin synthase
MLLGASEARLRVERELSVELVWTGPTTRFVPTRRTEQVLLDLIASADQRPSSSSASSPTTSQRRTALNEAASSWSSPAHLLEASTSHGGTLNYDPAATMRVARPSAELFTWKEKPEPFVDGKVHAKVAVVDGARAFITSANLTGHALEKNMEAGVLINGGSGSEDAERPPAGAIACSTKSAPSSRGRLQTGEHRSPAIFENDPQSCCGKP